MKHNMQQGQPRSPEWQHCFKASVSMRYQSPNIRPNLLAPRIHQNSQYYNNNNLTPQTTFGYNCKCWKQPTKTTHQQNQSQCLNSNPHTLDNPTTTTEYTNKCRTTNRPVMDSIKPKALILVCELCAMAAKMGAEANHHNATDQLLSPNILSIWSDARTGSHIRWQN